MAPGCGFTRPLTVAVSLNVPAPTVTFGDALVAIVGAALVTVTTPVPRPKAGLPWSVTASASATWTVCRPGAARASTAGDLRTSNVKSMRQLWPGPGSTMLPLVGVNRSLPEAGSIVVTVKSWPAHEPAPPVAVALSEKTPGSGQRQVDVKSVRPQDGISVTPSDPAHVPASPALQMVLDPSGAVFWFVMKMLAGTFVEPTVTIGGNAGATWRPAAPNAAAGATARAAAAKSIVNSVRLARMRVASTGPSPDLGWP